jgi:hypothetical protein
LRKNALPFHHAGMTNANPHPLAAKGAVRALIII